MIACTTLRVMKPSRDGTPAGQHLVTARALRSAPGAPVRSLVPGLVLHRRRGVQWAGRGGLARRAGSTLSEPRRQGRLRGRSRGREGCAPAFLAGLCDANQPSV